MKKLLVILILAAIGIAVVKKVREAWGGPLFHDHPGPLRRAPVASRREALVGQLLQVDQHVDGRLVHPRLPVLNSRW